MAIITLLTDFGTQDEYVGVLKGVICGINPTVTLVDLTHHIAPQDVVQAARTLKASFCFFPKGTIHLAVVDPGVGSERAVIAARYSGHLFVAPDNGLLAPLWERHAPEMVIRVEREDLFLRPVSRTFHGRDIFAPVAAHLSQAVALETLGRTLSVTQIVSLPLPAPCRHPDGGLTGEIVSVDRFGNLITNIDAQRLMPLTSNTKGRSLLIQVGGHRIEGLADSYAQVPWGAPLAIIGSRNTLEIAVRAGHAARELNIVQGAAVQVAINPKG